MIRSMSNHLDLSAVVEKHCTYVCQLGCVPDWHEEGEEGDGHGADWETKAAQEHQVHGVPLVHVWHISSSSC